MSILLVAIKTCSSRKKRVKSVIGGAHRSVPGWVSCQEQVGLCKLQFSRMPVGCHQDLQQHNRNMKNVQDGASCSVTSKMSMCAIAIRTCSSRNMHLKNATDDAIAVEPP